MSEGRYREARALAREIARIGSDSPRVNQAVGRILLETGALEEAQAQFEIANRLAPDSVEVLMGLSQSLIAQGDAERGYEAAQQALALDPDSTAVGSVGGWVLPTAVLGRSGSSSSTFRSKWVLGPRSPTNGRCPVSSLYSSTPSE